MSPSARLARVGRGVLRPRDRRAAGEDQGRALAQFEEIIMAGGWRDGKYQGLLCLQRHCGGAALTTRARSYRNLLSYHAKADTDMIEHHRPSFFWGRRTREIFKVLVPRLSSHLIEVEPRHQLPCYTKQTSRDPYDARVSQTVPCESPATRHTSLISHDAAASRLVFPLGY
jgi:hypothetical protein